MSDGEKPWSSTEFRAHRLTGAAFEQFSAGRTSDATLAVLASGEYSQRKLLLCTLLDAATGRSGGGFADPEPAWLVLVAAEERDPDVVRDIVLYPSFGVWLRRALRQRPQDVRFDYLYSMAAVAAIRTAIPGVFPVPVSSGTIVLPMIGRVRLPTRFPVGTAALHNDIRGARVEAMGGRVSVELSALTSEELFRPAPAHVVARRGHVLTLWLDDVDPYREFAEPAPPSELEPVRLAEWRKLLDEAWDLLTLRHSASARELAHGMTTLVPIPVGRGKSGVSSSAAIGATALPAKESALELAEVLLHEYQHSKINAVANLVDLVDPHDQSLWYAPWREDPRPLIGILHGICAFVTVSEFWRVESAHATDDDTALAAYEFAYRRDQVRRALDAFGEPVGLTDPGHQLVRTVAARLAHIRQQPVSGQVVDIVERSAMDHYASWRLRNIEPSPRCVEELVSRWRAGRTAGGFASGRLVAREQRPLNRPDRAELLRARMVTPQRFAGYQRAAARSAQPLFRVDAAYTRDDHESAATGYAIHVQANEHAATAWVGLGLCLHARADEPAARALMERPEVTVALYARLARAGAVDPVEVAAWVGANLPEHRFGRP